MDFCLSIGIDKYLHLKDTIFADNDAKEFDEVMSKIYQIQHHILLLGNIATYISIKNEVGKICNKISKEDRFIFFFAGHGQNINGNPHISTYDTNPSFIDNWFSIEDIIKQVNDKGIKQSLFFIDACESTIALGSRKDLLYSKFKIEELKKFMSDTSYTLVFCACSHKGVADVIQDEKHGIWSNFLIKALKGDEEEALKDGFLTNVSLQNYLSFRVDNYCKTDSACTQIQKAMVWGKNQRESILFEPPKKLPVSYSSIPKKYINNIYFASNPTYSSVNRLAGFNKQKGHFVPKYFNERSEEFVMEIASADIADHIEGVAEDIRKKLQLKHKEYDISYAPGYGEFKTSYFTYSYELLYKNDDLSQVIFTAKLKPYDIDKLIATFEKIKDYFPLSFRKLIFELDRNIDVEDLISRIEENSSEYTDEFEFDYDNYATRLTLTFKGINRRFVIYSNKLIIYFQLFEGLSSMLDSLKDIANKLSLISKDIKLLS
jgi:hypothetical protein